MGGALIVSAVIAPADHAPLDALRRVHFPAERNHLPAHLTLFHALPPSACDEAQAILRRLAARRPPPAVLDTPYSLGGGVAFRVRSRELEDIRGEIAERFHGSLTAQDAAGWRAHVTVQNKVSSGEARALLDELIADFSPRPLSITGLALDRYAGGPWEKIATYAFRG